MILAFTAMHGPIRAANGSNGAGTLLAERESAYNYIQVVQVGSETQLVLNEGVGVHSVYDPNAILTGGPWDYFMVAPLFNNPPYTAQQVKRVCIIGLGAGSVLAAFMGSFAVDASPPNTAAVAESGGRSQLAGLTAVVVISVLVAVAGAAFVYVP